MTTNPNLSIMTELQPIAKRMREREEQIIHGKNGVRNAMCEVLAIAVEQGQDITLVKAKLGKHSTWDEWRAAHVPNLSAEDASKCERLSKENTERSLGQWMFIFNAPKEVAEDGVKRLPPNEREVLWGRIAGLNKVIHTIDIEAWTETDKELTRHELEPTARLLWPKRFESDNVPA
jgi:hypothetical protein